jgi:hypothetical protein
LRSVLVSSIRWRRSSVESVHDGLGTVKGGWEGLDRGNIGRRTDHVRLTLGTWRVRVHAWWRWHQPISQGGGRSHSGTWWRLHTHLLEWWRWRSQEGRYMKASTYGRGQARVDISESCLERSAWEFVDLSLKTISKRFDRFEPQNRGMADWWTCGGILKLVSRRSEVEKDPSLWINKEKLRPFYTSRYLEWVLHVRTIWEIAKWLYIWEMAGCEDTTWGRL